MFSRRILLFLTLFCLWIVISAGLLIAAIQTSTGMNVLRRTVEWGGSRVLTGTLSIGELSGNPWRRIVARNVSMSLPDSLGGYEVIGAKEAVIALNLRNAWTHRPILSSVKIDGLRITYREGVGPKRRDSIGVLLRLGEDQSPADTLEAPTPLYIPDLQIVRGSFLYEDPRDSTRFQARNVFLRGRLLDAEHLSASLGAHTVSFSIQGYKDSLSTLSADFSLDGDSLTIRDLALEATVGPALAFQATGAIPSIDQRTISLSVTASGDAGAIGRIMGTETLLAGYFQLDGSLTNTLSDPFIDAKLESPLLVTEIGPVRQAMLNLRYAQNVLTIDEYSGRLNAGRIRGQGILDTSQPLSQYRLRLTSSALVLEKLPSSLVGQAFPLAGQVTLEADLSGAGFDPPELHGTAKATAPSLRIFGKPFTEFSTRTRYDAGNVDLTARTSTITAHASGRLALDGQTDLKTTMTIPDIHDFFALFGDSSVTGSAAMTAQVGNTIGHPSVHLEGQIQNLGYTGIPLGTLDMTGRLHPDGKAWVEANLGTKVRLAVDADLSGNQGLRGTVDLHEIRLSDYTGTDQDLGLDAVLEVEGLVEGSLQRPVIRGQGLLHDLMIRGQNLGNTSLALTLEGQDLSFTLVTPDFSVLSDGLISLTDDYPFDVRLDIKRASLSPLLTILSKRKIEQQTGRFSGQLRAIGFGQRPDLSTVTVSLDSLIMTMDDRELYFAAPSAIRLDRQLITIDHLELAGDFGYILINGIASLKPEGLVDVKVLMEDVQLDILSPFLLSKGNLGGRASGLFSLNGSPESPRINGLFSTADMQYRFNERVNQLGAVSFSLIYENRLLSIPVLTLDTPLGSSSATVAYPVDLSWIGETSQPTGETFTASLVMDHLSIGPLRGFVPSIPEDLDGRINGRIELTGPTDNLKNLTGIVLLDSLRLFGLRHELVNKDSVRLHFNTGFVDVDTIDIAFRRFDRSGTELGRITAGGRIALTPGQDDLVESDFTITAQNMEMGAILALLGEDLPVTGALSGKVKMTGTATLPGWDGRIWIGKVTYNAAAVDSMAGRFVYEYDNLVLHEFLLWYKQNTLTAFGTIPFDPGRPDSDPTGLNDMAITVEGTDFDLEFLSGITYDLERITGKADVQLTVGGTPLAPKSVGEVRIRDAFIQIRDINPPLRASQMRFVVDGDQFTLQPVEMQAGRGTFSLYSRLAQESLSLKEYEARAALKNVEIELVGTARLHTNGSLLLIGDARRGRLTGQSLAVTGTVSRPLNLGSIILGTGYIIRPYSGPDPFLERIALDLDVDIPRLRIRNNLADVEVEGGLAFSGTTQNPIITGSATALENGTILYLDTSFDLQTGRIEFLKRTPLESFTALLDDPVLQLDPEVTIQAEARQVRDIYGGEYDVTMLVSGRAMQPVLQLTANPTDDGSANIRDRAALAGPQVVSLLTFGLSNMDGSAQGAFTGIGNRALLMATGNQAEKLLKLDEVRIEGGVLNSSDAGTPAQITISKRINRRTRVTFTRLFDSSEYKIRVGYQLTNFLFIETFTDQISEREQNGFDLKVKFRFR